MLEIRMIRIVTAFVLVIVMIVCGCDSSKPTEVSPESTIQKVFQAELPSSVTNCYVESTSLMTRVVQGRFECATSDLAVFLKASKLLPDELESGINPLANVQGFDIPWWQPASLRDISGVECDWDTGVDVASCTLAAGRNDQGKRTTVYFMVVYENKKQTGLRPEIKANPNWGKDIDQQNTTNKDKL
jgi:hypothetical protein